MMQAVVSGYYGCGNAGDEAVLAGIAEAFRRQAGDRATLIALSQNPEATTRLHGLQAVDRMNLTALRRVLRDSDLLLSGGGSLLQDTTSVRSLVYYLWVARMAYSQGVPVMFYAQGIGPLRRPMSRSLVRMVANRADYITVRDPQSARLLATLGVTRPTIEVTADPAFALAPAAPDIVDALIRQEGLPTDAPLLGVALRPWGSATDAEAAIEAHARLLAELRRQCGLPLVLLPMHHPDDAELAALVHQHPACPHSDVFVVRGEYAPDALLGLVGRMQTMVAMRLHSLIFAVRALVPPFALSYDPKVENLMHGLGLDDSLEHWRGFDPEAVAGRVAGLLAQRETRVARLQAQVADLESRALRNADCALDVFDRRARLRDLLSVAK